MNTFRLAVLLFVSTIAASFAGETNTLPGTITIDGITYSNVTWHTVTPTTVTVFHSTGVASIPLEKLPPELQKRFGYDPLNAAEYRTAESARAAERAKLAADRKAKGEAENEASTAGVKATIRADQEQAEKQRQAEPSTILGSVWVVIGSGESQVLRGLQVTVCREGARGIWRGAAYNAVLWNPPSPDRMTAGFFSDLESKIAPYLIATGKTDIEGHYEMHGVFAGGCLVYAKYRTVYSAGFWLVPVSVEPGGKITVNLENSNMVATWHIAD